MGHYAYQAVDTRGRRVDGAISSANPRDLTRELEDRGLLVLHVEEQSALLSPIRPAASRKSRSPRTALLEITRALAALIDAGMPLSRALGASISVATGGSADILADVRLRLDRGEALSAAMAQHSAFFPAAYVGLIRAGERSGTLDDSFHRLTVQLEREEQLRAKLLSASIYPILLAFVGAVAVVVLLTLVLPRFADLLTGVGATLPASTRLLLQLSTAARRFWFVWLALPSISIAIIVSAGSRPAGRRKIADLILSVPAIGTLRRQLLAARFARLLGVLLGGRMPLLSALESTAVSITDPIAAADIERMRQRVREGASLSRAISDNPLWPPLLSQLVTVGEDAGRVDQFLLKAAEIFEERTDRAIQRVVALAEPALIIGFGLVVGFVALSLLQAIYSINAGAFR